MALIIIIFQVVTYSPLEDPNSHFKKILSYISIVVDSIFIVDMIAQFFLLGVKNWFVNANISRYLDLFINTISIIYFTPLGSNFIVKRFYSFRCLRVSYWISLRCENSQSMKVTANGFVQLIPKIFKFLIVVWLIYGFFANIIVRIYK